MKTWYAISAVLLLAGIGIAYASVGIWEQALEARTENKRLESKLATLRQEGVELEKVVCRAFVHEPDQPRGVDALELLVRGLAGRHIGAEGRQSPLDDPLVDRPQPSGMLRMLVRRAVLQERVVVHEADETRAHPGRIQKRAARKSRA